MSRPGHTLVVVLAVAAAAAAWPTSEPAHAQAAPGLTVQIGADTLVSASLPARPLVEPFRRTFRHQPRQ